MLFYPNHLLIICIGCSPMLIDWSEQSFLLTFQRIPNSIAGSWRTGIIVISPCKISWGLYLAGKIHHIIISHRVETILVLQYLMIFIEVRITARSSVLPLPAASMHRILRLQGIRLNLIYRESYFVKIPSIGILNKQISFPIVLSTGGKLTFSKESQ